MAAITILNTPEYKATNKEFSSTSRPRDDPEQENKCIENEQAEVKAWRLKEAQDEKAREEEERIKKSKEVVVEAEIIKKLKEVEVEAKKENKSQQYREEVKRREKEAQEQALKLKEQSQEQQTKTSDIATTLSPLAFSPGVPALTLSSMGNPLVFDPSQFGEVKDIVPPIGNFYFSSTHTGIVKITPKEWKIDEWARHPEAPQDLVWSMVDAPPRKMERETISAMRAFSNASSYTIQDLIIEVEKKDLHIRDLQN